MISCCPPRRAMGPAGTVRRPNWPVPITHRGGLCWGYFDTSFSYKLPRADRILALAYPQRSMKVRQICQDFLIKTCMAITTRHVGFIWKWSVQLASAEPPRWVIGTGQLGCLTVPGRAHCPSGGGGMISFGSASTTQYSLCPAEHARYCRFDSFLVNKIKDLCF